MAETPDSIVIVGGGLAGAKAAEALREKGYDGPVTLIAAEDELPYERPPLSKGYLIGKDEFDKAVVHPEAWYAENNVDLRRGTEATAIDRDGARGRAGRRHPAAVRRADPGHRLRAALAARSRARTRR